MPIKWTLAAIKEVNTQHGGHFFDRKTLRFFGETMRNYHVVQPTDTSKPDKVQIVRRASRAGAGVFVFDPTDGSIVKEWCGECHTTRSWDHAPGCTRAATLSQ